MSSVSSRWFFLLNELTCLIRVDLPNKELACTKPGCQIKIDCLTSHSGSERRILSALLACMCAFSPPNLKTCYQKSMFSCCEGNTWDLNLAVASWIKELETLKSKALGDFQLETNRQANFVKPNNRGNPESSNLAFDWEITPSQQDGQSANWSFHYWYVGLWLSII